MYNPSLRQEPRYEPASVIPLKEGSSLLDWLKATNRLIARDHVEETAELLDDDVEISELMDVDDHVYDEDDDDAVDLDD